MRQRKEKKDSDYISPVNDTLQEHYSALVSACKQCAQSCLNVLRACMLTHVATVFAAPPCVMPGDIRAVIECWWSQTAAQCHSQLRAPSLHSALFAF